MFSDVGPGDGSRERGAGAGRATSWGGRMTDGSVPPPGSRMAEIRTRGSGWAAAASAVLGGIWAARRNAPTPANRRLARLVAESPFRNVGPGVGYVGDAACARCHADVVESYRAHPMGRSVSKTAGPTGAESIDAPTGAAFDSTGYHYTVERRGDRLVHREQRLDGGEVVASVEVAVAYALGSGERGYSFLVERDGFVAQSPVAWYAQHRRYDVAPGYQDRNFHFERVILRECLSCHADGATPAGGAFNHYATPMELKPIGCERCHGPGALHVRRPGVVAESFDPNDRQPPPPTYGDPQSPSAESVPPPGGRPRPPGRPQGGGLPPGAPRSTSSSPVFIEAGPAGRSPGRRPGRADARQPLLHIRQRRRPRLHVLPTTRTAARKGRPSRLSTTAASCLAAATRPGRAEDPGARRACTPRQAEHDSGCVDCHMPRHGGQRRRSHGDD